MIPVSERKENTLCTETFGGFSLYWNGVCLTDGPREGDSQIVRVLEAVIHSGKKGVARRDLEEILFEGRHVDDIAHGIRTVLYNTRKKLEKQGLPKENYILCRDDHYYWNEAVPVLEDAKEFERLYKEAEKEEDPDLRLQLYVDAASYYSGEFLPLQAQMLWVFHEDKRYGEIFTDLVKKTTELLRANEDYNQLESLGVFAAKMQPFCGWEGLIVESLILRGRQEEASHLYEVTEHLYMTELGIRSFYGNIEHLEKIGSGLDHRYSGLTEICSALSGSDDGSAGGFMCSWPVFRGIYRMTERMSERDGQSVYIMLCTIADSGGKPLKDDKTLKKLSPKLADAISHSIRRSDAFCRYGDSQFLVLLGGITLEDCAIVQKRIDHRFYGGKSGEHIEYFCRSVGE